MPSTTLTETIRNICERRCRGSSHLRNETTAFSGRKVFHSAGTESAKKFLFGFSASRLLGFCVLILAPLLLMTGSATGHWTSPKEILVLLNDPQNKEKTGIQEASIDKNVPRLLIIKVSKKWYKLSKEDRIKNAEEWLKLWLHNVSKGVVSIIDNETQKPVIKFSPAGKAAVTEASVEASDPPAVEQ